MDAVYLWVDGSSERFTRDLRSALAAEGSIDGDGAACRFRDNGELRYSLRALARYAPWIERVHLVTNGDLPGWLDPSCERLHLVTHDAIFVERRWLPTFNSNAIEAHLHRIPNLSRKFLFLNDDLFFGRPIAPAEFGDERSGTFLFEPGQPWDDPDRGEVHDRAYARTVARVSAFTGRPPLDRRPAHTPQLYDRDVLAALAERFAPELRATATHRLRSPADFVLRVAYAGFTQGTDGHGARTITSGGPDYSFLRLEDRPLAMLRRLLGIWRRRPRFFCLNDDLGPVPRTHPVLRIVRLFLRSYYPRRSPFERR